MTAPKGVDELATSAAVAAEKLQAARASARRESLAAVRAVEQALLRALDGEKLRGLPEIAPGFRAARVRGKRIDLSLDHAHTRGREILVVTDDGKLSMARWDRGLAAFWRPASDDELLIEDVEAVAGAALEVLRRHLETVAKTTRRFAELQELGERISRVLPVA